MRDCDDADNWSPKKPKIPGEESDLLSEHNKNEILDNRVLMEELEHAGCTIPPEVNSFKLLLPVHSSLHENEKGNIDLSLKLSTRMLCAMWVHGKPVVLKLTDQHKVEVLWCLHGNQYTKQNHIIPLVDVIDGRLIVLPWLSPLLHFLYLNASADDVGVLAVQFMEGVAYLQHSSVAHLNLKPDNIVVHQDPKLKEVDLYIIDFNIAVFADIELTISGSDSTPGWCAPEISGKVIQPPLGRPVVMQLNPCAVYRVYEAKSTAGDNAHLVSAVDEPRPLSVTWHIRPTQLASAGDETELLDSTHHIGPWWHSKTWTWEAKEQGC